MSNTRPTLLDDFRNEMNVSIQMPIEAYAPCAVDVIVAACRRAGVAVKPGPPPNPDHTKVRAWAAKLLPAVPEQHTALRAGLRTLSGWWDPESNWKETSNELFEVCEGLARAAATPPAGVDPDVSEEIFDILLRHARRAWGQG